MRVFLGWSGDEAKEVALALKEWLPQTCPGLEPWISEDITKGSRWSAEIAKTLRLSKAGVFVLTPDNVASAWLHYEAGAISNVEDALVCTFLVRVDRAAVKPPLDVFQHTTAGDEDGTRKLVTDLADLLPAAERKWSEAQLRRAFDKWWSDLAEKLAAIKPPKGGAVPPKPEPAEMMEQILTLVRELAEGERKRKRASSVPSEKLVQALGAAYIRGLGGRSAAEAADTVGVPGQPFLDDIADYIRGAVEMKAAPAQARAVVPAPSFSPSASPSPSPSPAPQEGDGD